MRLVNFLTVDVPDDLPHDLQAEIVADGEPHDKDWRAKVERYIGAEIDDGAADIATTLPEGFAVRVRSAGRSVTA